MLRSAAVNTVTVAVEVLLVSFWSAVELLTWATLPTVVPFTVLAGTWTTRVKMATSPAGITPPTPVVQTTTPGVVVVSQVKTAVLVFVCISETKVALDGRLSVSTTSVAWLGPALLTDSVYVRLAVSPAMATGLLTVLTTLRSAEELTPNVTLALLLAGFVSVVGLLI